MPEPPISFARGAPAPELIPAAELADCAHTAAKRDGAQLFSYGAGAGYRPLREWIASRHAVDPERVVLTIGGLLGFVLYAAEALGQRPGRVLVEAPSYDRPLRILAREGAEIVAVPMDEEGLDLDALEAELRRTRAAPSFLYTIPTFQNPSGRTLGLDRRRRLAEIAAAHDLHVLEDDPYGLVRFEGESPPTLHELEGGERVTYTSSFSKTIAPGLRTGYFVLPEQAARAFEARAVSMYISPPFLAQATIAKFVERGLFEPNLERVRAELRTRRNAMLDALARELLLRASWSRPEGGYFVWLDLPAEVETSELAGRAERAGVTFVPGGDFFPAGSGLGGASARLAFSYEPPERIAAGVALLAEQLG